MEHLHEVVISEKIINDKKTIHAFKQYTRGKEYIGHGTHVLAFLETHQKNTSKTVTKCCFNHSGTIMSDTRKFKEQLELVSEFNEILIPNNISYIDENIVIYTQDYANPLISVDINFIIFMFKFIKNMLSKGMKFPDIYFKNFSFTGDKYKLFDFHNYEPFINNNFFITNIYNNVLKYIRPSET